MRSLAYLVSDNAEFEFSALVLVSYWEIVPSLNLLATRSFPKSEGQPGFIFKFGGLLLLESTDGFYTSGD
jgi:hypothetical protein